MATRAELAAERAHARMMAEAERQRDICLRGTDIIRGLLEDPMLDEPEEQDDLNRIYVLIAEGTRHWFDEHFEVVQL